ncbi:MAG TPA: hypothetical protein VHN14_12005, partial [Kofleriaceae bacterium]|nr:hypothetical protein [Kofleriaceae bacterium]
MRTLNLAIVGVLVLGASAWAQKAKYTRQQDVKVDVKLSDRVKPIVPKDPKDTQQQEQPLSADQVLAVEGLVGDLRAEQEQILVKLISDTPDRNVDEKSDYYFRLGELYAKQQRYWRLRGAELAIQADQTKNAKTRAEGQAAIDKAKQYMVKTIKTYQALTTNDAF